MVKAFVAKSLDDCLNILNQENVKIVAGGTDMLIQNRTHSGIAIGFKTDVLYVSLVDELKHITEDKSNIYIGATCSLEQILENNLVPKILRDSILEMASPAIRHTATLAGNIGNASPAGDSLVCLYLLDAKLEIKSINSTRYQLLKDFILGVRKIDLAKNEMITKIIIPKINFDLVYFRKVGPRLSDAISKLSFAGALRMENNLVKDIRFAFGAVNIFVVRRREIEEKLIGIDKKTIKDMSDEIIGYYSEFIKPIDDQRSNKLYRKEVCSNLIKEFLEKI